MERKCGGNIEGKKAREKPKEKLMKEKLKGEIQRKSIEKHICYLVFYYSWDLFKRVKLYLIVFGREPDISLCRKVGSLIDNLIFICICLFLRNKHI